MNCERSLAIIPAEQKKENYQTVTSNNFLDFLIGTDETFPYKGWDFSTEITFPPSVATFFEEFYTNKVEVPIFTDESISKINTYLNTLTGDPDYTTKLLQKEKGEAERSTTLYFDTDTQEMVNSPIIHGKFLQTKTNTYEHWLDTQLPMIEVHTHPRNILPSPSDYVRLLSKGYEDNRGITRGILVMCPNIQMLALPLPTTQLQPVEWVSHHFSEENENVNEALLPSRQKMLRDATGLNLKRELQQDEILQNYMQTVQNLSESEDINPEEIKQLEKKLKNETKEILLRHRQETINKIIRSNTVYLDEMAHSSNTLLLEFARSLDVQLFSSIDFTHFLKWSA